MKLRHWIFTIGSIFPALLLAQTVYQEPYELPLSENSIELGASEKEWVLRLYFGPASTNYSKTDITINTPSLSANIKNVTIYERTSYEYYKVWEADSFMGALRFIDEPTNKIFLELEKQGKFAMGVMYFHPKFLITNDGNLNDDAQVGINFIDEDKLVPAQELNQLFESYRLTKGLINLEGYVDYIVRLKTNEQGSCFEWRPGVGGGVYLGYVTIDSPTHNQRSTLVSDEHDDKMVPIGWSCSVNNKIVWNSANQRVSVQLGHSFSYGKLEYDFLDGYASHPLMHNNVNISIGATLWTIKRLKKP